MKSTAQSPHRNGGRSTKASTAVDNKLVANLQTLRFATWNVLTLAHTGYPEAIAQQLTKDCISTADLTEARIANSSENRVDGFAMLYSEATDHTKGVALMLNKRLANSVLS